MATSIINNFRTLAIGPHIERPASELFANIEGIDVYHSTFNPVIYLIHDPIANDYKAFERVRFDTDITHDLTALIRVLFSNR